MAIKNRGSVKFSKNIKNENKTQVEEKLEPLVKEEVSDVVVDEVINTPSEPVVIEPIVEEPVVEENIQQETKEDDSIKKDLLSLKKALLSVYNKVNIKTSRTYKNINDNGFVTESNITGFKHEKEHITIMAELLDNNNELVEASNVNILIKRNGSDFSDFVLLEKTKLIKSNKVVFQTQEYESCKYEIIFTLDIEEGEKIEYKKCVYYNVCCRVFNGYLNPQTKKYEVIKDNDFLPSCTCKNHFYELKYHKLPILQENKGVRVCMYIPNDLYTNDKGMYMFKYNGFQLPLYETDIIKINEEDYHVFLSTTYYENDENGFYDFSMKIEVV